jgi:hypothetical protein
VVRARSRRGVPDSRAAGATGGRPPGRPASNAGPAAPPGASRSLYRGAASPAGINYIRPRSTPPPTWGNSVIGSGEIRPIGLTRGRLLLLGKGAVLAHASIVRSLLSRTEAVAKTTLGSSASICDGTTHAGSGRKSQANGTKPAQQLRIAIRLPPLRFLSFLDPFVQQPPWEAVVRRRRRRRRGETRKANLESSWLKEANGPAVGVRRLTAPVPATRAGRLS